MRIFSWITKDTNINFMGAKKLTYGISIVSFVLSVALIAVKGFNFGIDFSGGILMEIKSEQPFDLTEIRNKLESVNIGEVNLQTIGDKGDELMIRAEADNLDEEAQRIAVKNIKEVLGSDVEYRRIETVGPQVGNELKLDGNILTASYTRF